MEEPEDKVGSSIIQEFKARKGDRMNWESHWQEIAERVLPRYSNTILSSGNAITRGEKRTEKMFDATASLGLEKFANIMDSMLTPRQTKWHRLLAGDPKLAKNRDVQLYLEEVNRLLWKFRYAPEANFASNNHEQYVSLGAFGTGAMFIDELSEKPGLRYKNIPISEVWFDTNHQGRVDTVFRSLFLTARQAVQKWGDAVPEAIKKKAEDTKANMEKFEFVHCVKPRRDADVSKADFRGMPFASYYVSQLGNKVVSEGGYNTFPYAISRYVTGPGEIYGRSPAMLALPSIKTLNEQKRTVLKQGHRVTDPVLLAHDDGAVGAFSLRPGALNPGSMSKDGKRLVDVLPTGNLSVGFEMMNQERQVINEAFLITLFQILTENPQMTATEALERAKEKGMLVSPTMGRQQSEYLGPMIDREIDSLSFQGLLPPMPPILQEAMGDFDIQYDSPLSRSQRSEEAAGFFRYIDAAGQYANLTGDNSMFDHLNTDVAAPVLMETFALPVSFQNTPEMIAATREQRAQEAEDQKQIEAAPAMAGLAKAQANGGQQ